MHNKKVILVLFILIALVQLYVPAKMIINRESILASGKEYKFRTVPIDPNDPFRGKYIVLNYKENTAAVSSPKEWHNNEEIYVLLFVNTEGYVVVRGITKEKPENAAFVKANISYVNAGEKSVVIDYPFNRFYMEESKAYEAEKEYNRAQRDTRHVTYGLVNIKDGEAVLKDVMIGGKSVRDLKAGN